MGKGLSIAIFWQLCVKMSIIIINGLGVKCMLKSNGVARLYYVEGV